MIRLSEKYYILIDNDNITLYEKKTIKKGKNAGNEKHVVIGYYTTIKGVAAAVERRALANIDTEELRNMDEFRSEYVKKIDDIIFSMR